jgi:hypothetical protein
MGEVVEVEFEGKTHKLRYSVDGGLITVRKAFNSRSADIGSLPLDVLAQMIGRELLEEDKQRGLL